MAISNSYVKLQEGKNAGLACFEAWNGDIELTMNICMNKAVELWLEKLQPGCHWLFGYPIRIFVLQGLKWQCTSFTSR